MIHRIDFSPPDQILNYWFIHKVSYASNIFCCLALSLPSNFASAQSSMTWQSAGTEIILMAQIQHCCLHATLAMKKAVGEWRVCGFSVQVLSVGTCAWGLMCLLCLVCRSFLCSILSKSGALMQTYFYKVRKLNSYEAIYNEMTQ